MLANKGIVKAVADILREYKTRNIVVDPVMIAKSGHALLSEEACSTVIKELLPIATVVTPNIHEAEAMVGIRIENLDDMKRAGAMIKETGCDYVVVKGGHMSGKEPMATDVVFNGEEFFSFQKHVLIQKAVMVQLHLFSGSNSRPCKGLSSNKGHRKGKGIYNSGYQGQFQNR
jgi:hydroxymethylpyrimidine/phosphomethylpyrimidine kinase